MRKAFLVAKHEYLKMVRRRSFLLGTLGVPLLIVVVMAISIAVAIGGSNKSPLGYVDHAGILDPNVSPPQPEHPLARQRASAVEIRAYPDEASARAALEAKETQAYYVVPQDYLQTGKLELYYWNDAPGEAIQSDFEDFLRANLVKELPQAVAFRAFDGSNMIVRSADGRREISESGIVMLFLPYVAGLFFLMAVMNSAQYLMRAVADEKENRTMEVMMSSLTPGQMIGGKAVGLVSVTLTQLAIWSATIAVGLAIAAQFFAPLRTLQIPWDFILVSLVYFLPSFALMAGVMIAIGAMVTEAQEGQQIAGVLNMFFVFPYFLVVLIFAKPDGPIPVFLTLFPPTAYITITMRWGMTVIPTWQLALSLALLVGAALGAVWLAARVFRIGMLNYGQRLRFRHVVAALRGR